MMNYYSEWQFNMRKTSDIELLSIESDVLLLCNTYREWKKSKNIIHKAQTEAKKIINIANNERDKIQTDSYHIGYQQGILASVEAMCMFFSDKEKEVDKLYVKLHADISTLLSDIINNEEVLIKLVDEWISHITKDIRDSQFQILLPYSKNRTQHILQKMLKEKYTTESIFEFHDKPYYIFKLGEQIIEFAPNDFVQSNSSILLSSINLIGIYNDIQNKSIQLLKEKIEYYLST